MLWVSWVCRARAEWKTPSRSVFSSRESNLGEKINSEVRVKLKNCDIIDDSWALNSGAVDVSLGSWEKEQGWLWLAGDRARRAEQSKNVDAKVGL